MAQRRMIDKKISVSEQVSNLSIEAQLIFTWSIPHADDIGLLPIQHKTLKALICPLLDISLETFGFHLEDIVSKGLWQVWEWENDKFYRIVKFLNNQTLKKDRKPNTLAKNIDNWKQVYSIWNTMETNGNPSKEKLSKEKLSKEKLIKLSANAELSKDNNFQSEYIALVEILKQVNPAYKKLYGNKFQRKAFAELKSQFGVEEVLGAAEFAVSISGKQYAPTITTPNQLLDKWQLLINYKQ